jgi:flagellar motor switch/type III secretory pathway protein FliN
VPASGPSFSPYPFERLRRLSRRDAALESAIARWLRPAAFPKLTKLAEGAIELRVVGVDANPSIDPHAALAEVRVDGMSIVLAASSRAVRAYAQAWLGGPDELDAPRPLAPHEVAIWCVVIATVLADAKVTGAQVYPILDEPAPPLSPETTRIELAVALGAIAASVVAIVPRAIALRAAPPRWPAWRFDVPIVVGRAAIPADQLAALAVRDIVTVDRVLELEIGDAVVGLTAAQRALEATVTTGYISRDMALPDDAHLELTVQLGTKSFSLRELADLAVGQVISLERPLAGPFDVRAGGRVLGQGELVDIEGELGVRIVSLASEK